MDRIELGVPDGKQEQQPACWLCFVVLVFCFPTVGYAWWMCCGPSAACHETSWAWLTLSPSCVRSGGGGEERRQHRSRESHPNAIMAQHNTTQRNATHRVAYAARRGETGRRNGTARRMTCSRVSKPAFRYAIPILWHTHLCCTNTRSPRYTASIGAPQRRDTMFWLRHHHHTSPGLTHCHYHCRLPTREPP